MSLDTFLQKLHRKLTLVREALSQQAAQKAGPFSAFKSMPADTFLRLFSPPPL